MGLIFQVTKDHAKNKIYSSTKSNNNPVRFDTVAINIETTTPEKPLHVAWNIASKNGKIAPIVNSDGTPYGLVTHESLFNLMIKLVGADTSQHQIKVREILDLPCSQAADTKIQSFHLSARIKD